MKKKKNSLPLSNTKPRLKIEYFSNKETWKWLMFCFLVWDYSEQNNGPKCIMKVGILTIIIKKFKELKISNFFFFLSQISKINKMK